MTEVKPIISMQGITKHFGGVTALEDVDFDILPDEVHALVGDNGAGKSTLIKILCGVHMADAGKILVDGSPVHITGPRDARNYGIEVIYQDLALVDEFNVVANVYLGKELTSSIGEQNTSILDERRMREGTKSVLERVKMFIPDIRQRVYYLSGGQRQGVAIGRAVNATQKIRVLIMDEPTAALGVEEKEKVLNLIRTLIEQHVAIVVISHNLEDVFQVADRVTVLRNGRRVTTVPASQVSRQDVVGYIVGAEAGASSEKA